MPQLLTGDELKALSRRVDVFTGYGDAGTVRRIQWLRKSEMPAGEHYTNPTPNPNGVSGWCFLDGVFLRRVHVCAHDPCAARHVDRHGNVAASKYGIPGPPDDHVRLYLPRFAHLAPTAPAQSAPLVSAQPPSLLPPIEASAPTPPALPPAATPRSVVAEETPPPPSSADLYSPPSSGHSSPRSVEADEPMHMLKCTCG